MVLTKAVDLLAPNEYAYLQNTRVRIGGRIGSRPTTGAAVVTVGAAPHTIVRLNDASVGGGYVRIIGAAGIVYVNATNVASGFSGNPLCICPFQPNQSVQPWAYVADSSTAVTITSNAQSCTGMVKVRSDNLTRKTGVKEPQYPCVVSTNTVNVTQWLTLPATTPPWTNINGVNPNQNYTGTDTQPPYPATILTPVAGATVALTVTGTATVNGTPGTKPGDSQPSSAGYPGDFVTSPSVVVDSGGVATYAVSDILTIVQAGGSGGTVTVTSVSVGVVTGISWTTGGTGYQPALNLSTTGGGGTGCTVSITAVDGAGAILDGPVTVLYAFTDANGNIIAQATAVGALPVVGNVGALALLTVPSGAAQLQIGIDSQGTHFASNSGSYLVKAIVSTSSITQVASIVGLVNAYVWGDSPHSGPTATYIWKNPNDSGTGISRTIGTAQATANSNSLVFDSSPEDGTVPVLWSTLNAAGSTVGSINLFSPALESDGYQDFNAIVTGSLWVPAGGTYAIQLQYKDQVMFGIGGGATSTGGTVYGTMGQAITVANGYPLLFVSVVDGSGSHHTTTIQVTFPAPGIYPFEIDWDYWYHTGRSLIVEMAPTPGAGVALIPPLPQGVRTNVQYWAKYRASESGAQSNPGQASPIQQTPTLADLITSPYTTDPQVTKADYYRQDDALANATYVITGPNDGLGPVINGVTYNTPVEDTLSDLGAAANQQMQTDDFEPFPTIGVPLSGLVTIVAGVVTWKSGDKFPLNMLPGTLMLIGSPAQNAYSLVARPTSITTIVIPDVPDTIGDAAGDGVPFNIAQPILAAQPLPSMWGPDAYGFMHACGDANNLGAYKWTKANNPDSAPQTNVLLLTSPSEALMGGGLVNGISLVFSTQHKWLMWPNFADAQATTEGISGNQWNPILGASKRGLYIRNCLCPMGGKAIAFRASDGIYMTSGTDDQSLTDETIYNLFPHENFTPVAVTIGPYTVYPPDDTKRQTLAYQNGYIYWDYTDSNSNPRTLVYGEAEKGWMVDVGQSAFTAHASEYAPGVNDTAVGCADSTVRLLSSSGTEVCTSVVATGADNAGDARAPKRISDVFVRAIAQTSNPVTVGLYANQYATTLTGFAPTSLTGSGSLVPYIVDFGSNQPQDVVDLEAIFSWNTSAANQLDLWQPGFMELPIAILSRVTDALTHGLSDWQHVALVDLMYYATAPVTVTLNLNQGGTAAPLVVTLTFPAGGSLFVPVKIALKPVPAKFKTCAWEVSSSAQFYLYGMTAWIGPWGQGGQYLKFNPFANAEQPETVEA